MDQQHHPPAKDDSPERLGALPKESSRCSRRDLHWGFIYTLRFADCLPALLAALLRSEPQRLALPSEEGRWEPEPLGSQKHPVPAATL